MRKLFLSALLAFASPLSAMDGVIFTTPDSYEDVVFGLENAVIDEGLVVDHVNHVGEMLARTGPDVGSDVTVYLNAEIFSFCSALLSRKMMEIDPLNLMYCPYQIFVMVTPDKPDQTTIGYRKMPEGPMQEVEELLDRIVKSAIGMD